MSSGFRVFATEGSGDKCAHHFRVPTTNGLENNLRHRRTGPLPGSRAPGDTQPSSAPAPPLPDHDSIGISAFAFQ